MSKGEFRISMKFRPRDIVQRISALQRRSKGEARKFVDEIEDRAVTIYKSVVPVRTGKMKASVKVLEKQTKSGGIDLRSNVKVGPTVPYAEFVDKGAKPSPGAFVPLLGVRVKTGTHPGQRAQNFNEEAKNKFDQQAFSMSKKLTNKLKKLVDSVGR